jgi:pimeloyl-ACP methyl ester carboxylesterase
METEPLVRDATVTLDGLRFHYRDWGDPAAPPVVLLHAYTQHARTWDTVARGLSDRFRVMALDQRGHGESDHAADYHELRLVGDVASFADALGLDHFSIVGFSIGGNAAASYALLYPDRVQRLVLLECFTSGDEPGDEPWFQAMRAHLGLLRALPELVAAPEEAAAAFRPLAPYADEDELRHWMRGGLVQAVGGGWNWRYDPAFRVPGPPGRLVPPMDVLSARLAGVRCPMLLPVGAESWMVEPTARIAMVNPRARVVTIPQAGHWVPLDNPSGFLEVVGQFLDQGD